MHCASQECVERTAPCAAGVSMVAQSDSAIAQFTLFGSSVSQSVYLVVSHYYIVEKLGERTHLAAAGYNSTDCGLSCN